RNGYYFTLDRLTGEHLVTSKFSDTVNWAKGLNDKGQPIRDPAKGYHIAGARLQPRHGPLLRPSVGDLRDVLPERNRSAGGHGPRRQGRNQCGHDGQL